MKKSVAKILITALLAVFISAGDFMGNALDLPIKSVNGRRCYVYKVKRGDTVYGVARTIGVSRNDIIDNNPSAADGLVAGMALYFPVEDFENAATNAKTESLDNSTAVNASISANGSADNTAGTASGNVSYKQYVVKKGDTPFGIANKFGISVKALVDANPDSDTGVKAGQVLNIPVSGESAETVQQNDATEIPASTEVNPGYTGPGPDALREVRPGVMMVTPVIDETDSLATATDSVAPGFEYEEPELREYTVAVMLPFMLNEETPGKAAIQATDFYKGFLIAADTLETLTAKFNIIAIDTESNSDRVHTLLTTDTRLQNADVIVAPDNVLQLAELAEFGDRNNVYVFNGMNAHDSTYLSAPHAIQASIPSVRMIEKAVEACIESNGGFTPVLLVNESSRNDKKNFVDALTQTITLRGIVPLTVSFNGSLSVTDITDQLGEPDETTRYLFIPSSGSLAEFNKFSNALEKFRTIAVAAGGETRVFGFPEWTAFRGDSRKALHDIDAMVYARSFSDPASMQSRGVDASFVKWFGHKMTDGVPTQGLLGYDTGCFILKALTRGAFDEGGNISNADLRGVQSTFFLRRDDESRGPVNDALYIVRFMPGEVIDIDIK